jgi:hypothetical protein
MPEVGMHEPTITRWSSYDHGAGTRMTFIDGLTPRAAEAGWNAPFDKLAARVAG